MLRLNNFASKLVNSRMVQTTKWLQAIQNYMKVVKLIYQQCMARFSAQTANIHAHYSTNCIPPVGMVN